jgi:hypothetical protein
MFIPTKYIKINTNGHDKIIVFSGLIQHKEFKNLNPISAGFISIGATIQDGHPITDCTCYGKSDSLGIDSAPEDTELAKKQILGIIF